MRSMFSTLKLTVALCIFGRILSAFLSLSFFFVHDQYAVRLGDLVEVMSVILCMSLSNAMARLEVRVRYEQ